MWTHGDLLAHITDVIKWHWVNYGTKMSKQRLYQNKDRSLSHCIYTITKTFGWAAVRSQLP